MKAEEFERLMSRVDGEVRNAILEADTSTTPMSFIVSPEKLLPLCIFLFRDKECYFDLLSCLSGIDNGVEAKTMEVAYNLYSVPFQRSVMLKALVKREDPVIDSVSHIWRTALWHEREAFDLLGIRFRGHKNLRRILLPSDWQGHPLRKDYQPADRYHGVEIVPGEDPKAELLPPWPQAAPLPASRPPSEQETQKPGGDSQQPDISAHSRPKKP